MSYTKFQYAMILIFLVNYYQTFSDITTFDLNDKYHNKLHRVDNKLWQ